MSEYINSQSPLWDVCTMLRNNQSKKEDKSRALRNGNCESKKKQTNHESINKKKKLDDNNDADKHSTISKTQSRLIIDARTAKKWKQKDLARKINEPVKVVNDYECCKAIPDNKIINKLEKILHIKLRIKK